MLRQRHRRRPPPPPLLPLLLLLLLSPAPHLLPLLAPQLRTLQAPLLGLYWNEEHRPPPA